MTFFPISVADSNYGDSRKQSVTIFFLILYVTLMLIAAGKLWQTSLFLFFVSTISHTAQIGLIAAVRFVSLFLQINVYKQTNEQKQKAREKSTITNRV